MAEISRRTLLVGAIGTVAAAGAGALAYDRAAHQLPPGVPGTATGPSTSGRFTSARRGGVDTGWTVAYPPGTRPGDRLPVLVVLHGRGADHRSAFDDLHLDRFLAAGVSHGMRPFAVASVDGGDHSYWHPRRDGDAAGMVVEEFLPLLGRRGLEVARPALLGWSMGGYGALYLASRLGRSAVASVVAESPAVWHQAGQSASGAFDDAADFNAHAIFPRLGLLRGMALRVDCGDADGFAPVTRDLRAALSPTPAGGIEPGGHDATYWRSQAAAQLAFVATHFPA